MYNTSLQQKSASNQMDKKTLHRKGAEKTANVFVKLKLVNCNVCRSFAFV